MMYAVGQGALAVECRKADDELVRFLKVLDHRSTRLCCLAERELMSRLEGGCSVPLGVESSLDDGFMLTLRASLVARDGSEAVSADSRATLLEAMSDDQDKADQEARQLGRELSQLMYQKGASRLLALIRSSKEESS